MGSKVWCTTFSNKSPQEIKKEELFKKSKEFLCKLKNICKEQLKRTDLADLDRLFFNNFLKILPGENTSPFALETYILFAVFSDVVGRAEIDKLFSNVSPNETGRKYLVNIKNSLLEAIRLVSEGELQTFINLIKSALLSQTPGQEYENNEIFRDYILRQQLIPNPKLSLNTGVS